MEHINYVAFCSYGNDSIALLECLRRKEKKGVTVVYSDTGWAAPEWENRLKAGEAFARSCGFQTIRLKSEGLESLVRKRKGWPRQGMQFCTQELKIRPAQRWLDEVDPEVELTCCVGVRREESRSRAQWPEWTEESKAHGMRSLWAPLVRILEEERNEMIEAAGFEVLPHRSMECFPCINSNRQDLVQLSKSPKRIKEIAVIEESMGFTGKGKPRVMFRPYRHMGAVGIEEVVKWALSGRGKYEPPDDCGSGMCGS